MTARPFIPRPYQEIIIQHALSTERCAIFAGMGLGKSASILSVLNTLQLVDDRPALIVAPKRVALTTWPDEARKWRDFNHMTVLPICGSEAERRRALKQDANIYTTNYEQLPWLTEFYGDRWPFANVIPDELTKVKGFRLRQGTTRAKALARVAHTKVKRITGLTGTPAPNGLMDLWGQIWFLDKGERLGRTFDAFKQRFFRPKFNGFGYEPLESAQAQIQAALKDLCLTIDAKDWFDLREPIVNNIYVELPAKARGLYEKMEKEMFAELAVDKEVSAVNAAVKTMRCLHIAGGFSFYGEERQWQELHDVKVQALEEIIEEAAGMPVLVAYQWTANLERLKKAFPAGRQLDANPQTMRDWNEGKIPVLFAHPQSAGHGLNLQDGGNILVYFDHWWNLEERMQILERVGPTRQMQAGHDRPVFVHNLIAAGTVDEMVMERVESKRSTQDILMEAMKIRGVR